MEVRILKEDKTSMDIEIGSLTIAEVLRTYLNKEGAKLAAWRREHPTKNPVLHIESDNPKKLLKIYHMDFDHLELNFLSLLTSWLEYLCLVIFYHFVIVKMHHQHH